MSEKESRRAYIVERVVNGQLTVRQGARLLDLSERQIKRLKRRVAQAGVAGDWPLTGSIGPTRSRPGENLGSGTFDGDCRRYDVYTIKYSIGTTV